MKSVLKALFLAAAVMASAADVRPTSPEPMSGKTVLKFWEDNGIKAGWNLGNTLDAHNAGVATEGQWSWGGPGAATQALFNGVKTSGFDIVRIPVTWVGHIGSAPNYTISEARLQRVAEIIGYAKTAGIKSMIINVHHDGNYGSPPNTVGFLKFAEVGRGEADNAQVKDQLGKVWTQIANYFKNYGDYLIFETLNEVHSGNWGCSSDTACNTEQDRLFDWNQTALNAIRATGGNNAKRFVAVPGLGSTEPGTVIAAHNRQKLLPSDPNNGTNNLIVSIHFYAPWQYTVADANASQVNDKLRHTISDAELNNIDTEAGRIKTTFINNGIAAYYGEWGGPTDTRSSMDQTVKDTHKNYIRRVASAANANGILPIIWDDGGSFKILERSNGQAKTGFWSEVLTEMMGALKTAPSSSSNGGSSSSVVPSSSSVALSSSSAALSSSSVAPSSSSAVSSSSSIAMSSSSKGEISSSSGEVSPIAYINSPLPAIHSPTYYNMKGEPIGSAKPEKPGVYLVKQGNSVRKMVVR